MKIHRIGAPWLEGSIPEIQLNTREAGRLCLTMKVHFPKPGWIVDLGPTWLGRASLTNHGGRLYTLNLR